MGNLSPHIVHHKRFGEIIFVVGVRHGLEVKSHHGTTLNITKLVVTCCCVAISIEESCHTLSILREVWIVETSLPILIVIHDVVSFWAEKSSEFFIFENRIKDSYFINGWLSALVSNTRCCH